LKTRFFGVYNIFSVLQQTDSSLVMTLNDQIINYNNLAEQFIVDCVNLLTQRVSH